MSDLGIPLPEPPFNRRQRRAAAAQARHAKKSKGKP